MVGVVDVGVVVPVRVERLNRAWDFRWRVMSGGIYEGLPGGFSIAWLMLPVPEEQKDNYFALTAKRAKAGRF